MLLRKKLLRLIDLGTTRAEMAKIAQVSNPTIGRFIEGGTIDFMVALQLVRHYFPEEESEIMLDLLQDKQKKNARTALEYSFITGNLELSALLVDNLKQSTNRIDQDWVSAYELELLRNREEITPKDLEKKLDTLHFETEEMKLYSSILYAYSYYDQKEFSMTRNKLMDIEHKTQHITNPYIQTCYNLRIGQVLSLLYLQRNEIEECRKYSRTLTESTVNSSLYASVCNTLGYSYIFEDPQQALHYLSQSREMFKEKGREKSLRKLENTISFVQIYHGIEPEYINLSNDDKDMCINVFYCLKKGHINQAQQYLDLIKVEDEIPFNRAFYYYYLGEITQDYRYYTQSIKEFKSVEDAFFRQLPIHGLKKLGFEPEILELLSS